MKKILLFMFAMLMTVAASAQVVLGNPSWNIKDGQKISLTKVISVSFPNAEGVTAESVVSIAGNIVAADEEANDDNAFDGMEASIANPVDIVLSDIIDVQPATTYTLILNSVLVDGAEQLAEGETLQISFKTRGAERQMSWTFTIDGESVKKIHADDKNEANSSGQYWSVVTKDTRHYYHVKMNYDEMMLDANTVLPMTEGLTFTANADKIYVGDTVTTTYKENLVFNTNHLYVTVPDCKVGDVVAFTAIHASANKPASKKYASIMSQYGTAVALDGFVSEQTTNPDGVADSITLNGTKTAYKFEVQEDGDITFKLSNARLYSITITEGVAKVPCKYSVKAVYKDGENQKVLKELVPETDGITGTTVKANYSYWLKDDEGNLYTHGAKGSEFVEALDLMSDTTFYINYAKANISGVVFLAEGEDFFDEDATERTIEKVTQANAVIRSSMGKAAYATADTKITTLPAGTYMFKAIIFDNKGSNSGFTQNIGISSNTEEDLVLAANADNWTEAEQIFTLNNESDIIWRAGGSDSKGIDIMVIYATDELPEDPDGVAAVEANETVAKAVRKVVKNGQLLIENANGAFTVAGAQVK